MTFTVAEYESMGGMAQVVQTEVTSCWPPTHEQRQAQLDTLHDAFIPWLATINPDNDQPMRRLAHWDDLAAAGVTKVFSDVLSGARDDRPGLADLLAYVRDGDTVVVWKLDRLGRNMLHILQTVKELTERGVTLVSTTDGIDSSTPAGRMMIGVWVLLPNTNEN